VSVRRRPVVLILPTGDEVRPIGTEPGPGEILDTSSLMLAARCRQLSALPQVSEIQPDDPPVLVVLKRMAGGETISAEEAPKLKPFVDLAEKLGSFAGQLTDTGIKKVQIAYEGEVAAMNTKALTSAAVAGLLRPMLQDVNVVSAPIVAKDRGIVVEETRRDAAGDYDSLIVVTVVTDRQTRSVSGTVYADGRPRIIDIKGIRIDAEFGPSMLYVTNQDKPGFVGRFATLLAEAGINIATFHLGRESAGGNAIALVEVDGAVPPEVLGKVQQITNVQQVKPLTF